MQCKWVSLPSDSTGQKQRRFQEAPNASHDCNYFTCAVGTAQSRIHCSGIEEEKCAHELGLRCSAVKTAKHVTNMQCTGSVNIQPNDTTHISAEGQQTHETAFERLTCSMAEERQHRVRRPTFEPWLICHHAPSLAPSLCFSAAP